MTDDSMPKVGDYVRWEFPRRDRFAEGEVTAVDGKRFTIRITACTSEPWGLSCPDPAPGREHTFHVARDAWNNEATSIRRIPRRAEAQATVPVDRIEHHCQGTLATGAQCPRRTTATNVRIGEWMCPDCVAREVAARAAPPTPLAPVLVDGLTRERCLERYRDNMQRADNSLPWPLTPAQQVAAREEWSAALRAKVAATREAERNRVRVTPELDPWD